MEKGEKFERFIEKLLKRECKFFVKRNVVKKKETKSNGKIYSQIDLTYGLILKTYVECKYRSSSNVQLEDVAKFYSVMCLNKCARGELYTNQHYTKRAKEFAKKCSKNIKLYDKNDIIKAYYSHKPLLERIFIKKKPKSLEKLIS